MLVFSQTEEQHVHHLQQVFQRLQGAALTLRGSKYHIGVSKVCYLGHIFDYNGMHPDPCKVSCVQDWPTPTNATTLKQFLGLASYYRRYIEKFADIAAPLHNLTKKDISFSWSPECTKAFVELKSRLTQAPILAFPHPYTTDKSVTDVTELLRTDLLHVCYRSVFETATELLHMCHI